jgi:hypothetical protein
VPSTNVTGNALNSTEVNFVFWKVLELPGSRLTLMGKKVVENLSS